MKIKTKDLYETDFHSAKLNPVTARSETHYPQFEIMTGSELDSHLGKLIELDESEHLFFSIYLDLSSMLSAEMQLRELVCSVMPTLSEESVDHLFQVESYILDIIGERIRDEHKGLAVHFRFGAKPELYAIVFHLPVAPAIFADSSPNILQLIEMRDSYDRYVVLISTETQARIMEIVVGTVTREAWLKRPELRKRLGREWSVEHFRNHERERSNRFIAEKIEILKSLFRKGGYSHLVLAGSSHRIAAIEKKLPEEIKKRIIDICNLDVSDPKEEVVRKTIQMYVEQESFESRSNLQRLERTIVSGGGAVAGLDGCEDALSHGVIETLIITKTAARHSRTLRVFKHRNPDGNYLTTEKRRQKLLERAIKKQIRIEFVDSGTFLDDYCGVGAVLRYRGAENVVC
jgi:hypothetical protein